MEEKKIRENKKINEQEKEEEKVEEGEKVKKNTQSLQLLKGNFLSLQRYL